MEKLNGKGTKERGSGVRLSDVATALGVSKGTVSMALKGNPVVAEQTRKTVAAKAEELGYIYNRGAASLSTGVTGLVGLAVHNLANPYFARVCAAIEEELEKHGQIALLCNLDESREKQARFIKSLNEQNADGLIICPAAGTTAEELPKRLGNGSPVVLFAREIEGAAYDFVGNDDETAMRLATRHIIEQGHTRIAFIGAGTTTSVARRRKDGFLAEMASAGQIADPALLIDSSIYPEGGEKAVEELMSMPAPPTAVICFTDYVAFGAYSKLHELGYAPGQDVALIGCDGISEGARSYVKLSTINVQKRLIGETAAKFLQKRLEDPGAARQEIYTSPLPLFRSSSGHTKIKHCESKE